MSTAASNSKFISIGISVFLDRCTPCSDLPSYIRTVLFFCVAFMFPPVSGEICNMNTRAIEKGVYTKGMDPDPGVFVLSGSMGQFWRPSCYYNIKNLCLLLSAMSTVFLMLPDLNCIVCLYSVHSPPRGRIMVGETPPTPSSYLYLFFYSDLGFRPT